MPQPQITITGKIVNQKVVPMPQDKKLYMALLEIPPEGRERTPKQLKLTTYSSTMHGQLTELRKAEEVAGLVCLLHSHRSKNELINNITPVQVIKLEEEQ